MNKKTVLLTGASRGIGQAICNELSNNTNYTIITPTRADMNLEDISSVEKYISSLQNIDIIINNAGIISSSKVENIADKDLLSMLSVNLAAPLRIIGKFVPYMKKQRYGKIINFSSILGVVSKENMALYSMSKFGINGITKSLAHELGEFNILVNSVCPGYINTEMTQKNVSEIKAAKMKSEIPLKRFAEPAEIAKLVKFLVSDDNTYITGQTIIIDGGLLA